MPPVCRTRLRWSSGDWQILHKTKAFIRETNMQYKREILSYELHTSSELYCNVILNRVVTSRKWAGTKHVRSRNAESLCWNKRETNSTSLVAADTIVYSCDWSEHHDSGEATSRSSRLGIQSSSLRRRVLWRLVYKTSRDETRTPLLFNTPGNAAFLDL